MWFEIEMLYDYVRINMEVINSEDEEDILAAKGTSGPLEHISAVDKIMREAFLKLP